MEDNKEAGLQGFLVSVGIFFVTPIITGFATYVVGQTQTDIVRNVILSILFVGILLYTIESTKINKSFLYNNGKHLVRIGLLYVIGLAASVASGMLPQMTFPLMAFGIILTIFSNSSIGVAAYFLFSLISILLSAGSMDLFLYYFFTGYVGIVLFQKSYETIRVFASVLIITVLNIVFVMALIILRNYEITPTLIIDPALGIFSNAIILSIILFIFNKKALHPYDDKYMEINDPEYNLLTQLKEYDKKEYYHAIHTAYLSDRIADKLHRNRMLAKGGGYYHRIGILRGKNFIQKNLEIGKEYGFPPELMKLIQEYVGTGHLPTEKETIIVSLADSIVTSIMFLIEKDSNTKIDYVQVIDVVFKKKLESGILAESTVTISEYSKMKKYFKEEELYYDFLR